MKAHRGRATRPSQLDAAEIARWNELCRTNVDLQSPFLSYAFARAAEEVFKGTRVAVIEENGEPAAFLPLQYAGKMQRLFGYAQRLGGELNDHFGLAATPDFQITPQRLLEIAGLNGLFFTHLDASQQSFGLTGDKPELGLRILLPQGGQAYWEQRRTLDKRFVADTERCWRKLTDARGPIRFTYNEPDPLPHLDDMIARKREQYARTGVGDVLEDSRAQAFLRILAQTNEESCRGTMSTIVAGSTFAASHFGLSSHRTLHYWWPVFDPDLRSFSPGRLLLRSLVGAVSEHSIDRIDLGAGDTPAKRDFANAQVTYVRGLWHRGNARAWAIRAYQSAQWRLSTLPLKFAPSPK